MAAPLCHALLPPPEAHANSQIILSRKRFNDEVSATALEEETSPKRARVEQDWHFPLMQLATEIRLKILRELLWQEEYLFIETDSAFGQGGANFVFHPNILRVCKKLLREGLPILYDNTIYCELCSGPGPYCSTSFLQTDWDVTQTFDCRSAGVYPSLLQRVKKLHFWIQSSADDATTEILRVRMVLRRFVQRMPQLSHITAGVDYWGDHFDTDVFESPASKRHDVAELFLEPLTLMRGLKVVNFEESSDGRRFPEEDACRFAKSMMSSSPAVDLPSIFSVLHCYVDDSFSRDHCPLCSKMFLYLSCARQAMDMHDLATFKFLRKEILSIINEHHAFMQLRLCKHDPPPESSDEALLDVSGNIVQSSDLFRTQPGNILEDVALWSQIKDGELYERLEDMSNPRASELRDREKSSRALLRQKWREDRIEALIYKQESYTSSRIEIW